jgi:hypothetical protein
MSKQISYGVFSELPLPEFFRNFSSALKANISGELISTAFFSTAVTLPRRAGSAEAVLKPTFFSTACANYFTVSH